MATRHLFMKNCASSFSVSSLIQPLQCHMVLQVHVFIYIHVKIPTSVRNEPCVWLPPHTHTHTHTHPRTHTLLICFVMAVLLPFYVVCCCSRCLLSWHSVCYRLWHLCASKVWRSMYEWAHACQLQLFDRWLDAGGGGFAGSQQWRSKNVLRPRTGCAPSLWVCWK